MAKCMIGPAGGGKVIVSGLTANKILQGTTISVKQGAKVIASVDGSIPIRTDIYEAPLYGQDPNKGAYGILGNNVWAVPAVGYYPNFAMETSRIDIHGPSLARAAGLTQDILLSGKTVLGVTGKLDVLAAYGVFDTKGGGFHWTGAQYQNNNINSNGMVSYNIGGKPMRVIGICGYRTGGSDYNICGVPIPANNTFVISNNPTNKTFSIYGWSGGAAVVLGTK